MRLPILLTALLCIGSCPLRAYAERPPEDRNKAHVILVGVVEAISETWVFDYDYYKVRLRIVEVERCSYTVPGDHFEVTCFRGSRPWPGTAGAGGHEEVLAIGDKVRVYAILRGTGYEGVYPYWYDLLQSSSRSWLLRQWDSRKVRVASFMVLIAVSVLLGAWWVRRRRTRCPVATIPPGAKEVNHRSDFHHARCSL